MQDEDRYIWLIAHMGLIEDRVKRWNPSRDGPLLKYLQDFVDQGLAKVGNEWVKKQRELLRS